MVTKRKLALVSALTSTIVLVSTAAQSASLDVLLDPPHHAGPQQIKKAERGLHPLSVSRYPKRQLFARLCLGSVAIFLSHFLESLALAGILAFAGILRALARGLTLTRIYAVAMDLGFIGASCGERTNTEQKRGGRGNRGAGDGLGHLHLKFLLMIDDRG